MILEHKDDLKAFREAVRTWTRETAPPERAHEWQRAKGPELVEVQKWWMDERRKVGLATPHWPVEYGGAGLGLEHQIIMEDEFARGHSPGSEMFVISLNHVPATLIPHGTEAQKKTYLPAVAAGALWCQGFSEPAAGSDLAGLKTRAVLDDDHYVVNGQKIWSTNSMYASQCLLLVRTDPAVKKHQGITYLIMDMDTPGVEVRPIRKSTGGSNFGEIFLTDVRIPVANRIGEENTGWMVSQSTLASERGVLSFNYAERDMMFLVDYYAKARHERAAWLDDPELQREFMTLFGELQSLRQQIRVLLREPADAPTWSMLPSLIKVAKTTLNNRIHSFRIRAAGLSSQFIDPAWRAPMYEYLESFGMTISGGSNEIMRNLIAERGLGMPRG
ncbi:Acyl-CoA dehydrogenase [Novosphingobium sp. CF614]|uniref:acyl-CoA dehydrogenase family protein n=1 Tax=Novosphingobium sp. CF614 TaxID=1884364 RepID=UPI0008EAAA54|nr:acyl-CoA dehydrogenase family protein [Novosphingobium sp. CF614]SFF77582.1 Acyl-CoA dehydrogenase [Novosphingobium sp. CF614]